MARGMGGYRVLAFLALAGILALVACAPAAAPQPTAAPAKPATQPTAAPAAPAPTKPAAQPSAAPAAPAPTKPAAQPAAAPAKVIELRAGGANIQGHPISNAVDKFAELVKQKTNGEVTVRNFYQALGVEQQLTQSVMSGSVDLGMISGGNAARFTKAFMVYDLPFLFKDYFTALKSLDSPTGKKLVAQFEKDLGVKYLWACSFGSGRDIQTRNKQLKVPADVRGLKIRVVSTPIELATFKAWGANPTPVDWSQTFSGLQQGVVDGLNIVVASLLADNFHEVVKFAVRLDYQAPYEAFYISQKKFDSLSPAHQKAILDAAQEAKEWNYKDTSNYVEGAIKELEAKHGVKIYKPTPEEYQQWASIRDKVWAEANTEMKDQVDLELARQLAQTQ